LSTNLLFAKGTKKISVYGMRNAVIGGVWGEWKLKSEPDKEDTINVTYYFDEDAPDPEVAKDDKKEYKGNEKWTGKGNFKLPDFAKFVEFLSSMVVNDKDIRK
jgi:hypothetical protein